ncbi:hypothetical protein H920_16728 [Fukomys damarensis]|uniref:Uncharacterized protein n=1 Tax=Fukomys damarensis TaxID=885580 RepID=A0A091CRM4_FUKDA|nr:hypothetical protein H920_16728 [Fukomys damarensis]
MKMSSRDQHPAEVNCGVQHKPKPDSSCSSSSAGIRHYLVLSGGIRTAGRATLFRFMISILVKQKHPQ